MNKQIAVVALLTALSLHVAPLARGQTTTFTGDSDADKFVATDSAGGTVVYAADSFTWTLPQWWAFGGQDLPAANKSAGDFEYRIDVDAANVQMGDFYFVAFFDDPSAASGRVELRLGDPAVGGSLCVGSTFFGGDLTSVCGQTAPISVRTALAGTMLSVSYSGDDGTTWTELASIDMATTDVDPTVEWWLSMAGWGIALEDNFSGALPANLTIDAISVTYTPAAGDISRPEITILGDNPTEIVQGGAYVDAGATAADNADGDITANIVTVDTVDTSTVGDQTVTYTVVDTAGNSDEEVRTVTVFVDEPPVITLSGDAAVELVQNGPDYTEPGATAVDRVDGEVAVIIGGDTVDVTTLGVYTITYDAFDAAGLGSQSTRTVTVVADQAAELTLDVPAGSYLLVGETLTEAVATAIDDLDGDISGSIVIGGDVVDPTTPGRYTVTYTVTDSVGNTAQTARVVKVVEELPSLDPVMAVFTGSSDDAQFAAVLAPLTPAADGSVVTDADTITFNGGSAVPADHYVAEMPVRLPGTGDFVYTMAFAMSHHADTGGWWEHGMRLTLADDSVVTLLWGNYGDDGSQTWGGSNWKCVTINGPHICEDVDATVASGDIVLRLELSGTTLTSSYSADGVNFTEADVQTLDADVAAGWTLATLTYGLFDASAAWAPLSAVVDEISVTYTPLPGPVMTLVGDPEMALEVGVDVYSEPGATADDDLFGDVSDLVVVTGAVDTSVVGSYVVTYDVTNANGLPGAQLSRIVNVSSRPVITLHGPAEITVIQGERYWQRQRNDAGNVLSGSCDSDIDLENENGCFWDDVYDDGTGNWSDVTVMDAEDGDITTAVIVEDDIVWTENPSHRVDVPPGEANDLDMTVNTGWVGQYLITYDAVDSAGLRAHRVTRTINVVAPEVDPIPVVKDSRDSGQFCFIDTASQQASTTSLAFLTGLLLLGLVGCFAEERARRARR